MTTKPQQPKLKVGQVVRCYGIPESGEGGKFIGYDRICFRNYADKWFYGQTDGQIIRESRLRPLTKREMGISK